MAPEQLAGADPDPRQDLYALAACGLEILTEVRPPGAQQAARDLVTSDPAHGPLVTLLLETADPDPTRRPGSAAELASRLRVTPLASDPDDEAPHVFDQLTPTDPGPAASDLERRLGLLLAGGLAALLALWLLLAA